MEQNSRWFKIAELEKLSGMSRRTIHFYLQQQLIHPPVKTGKTMAYYDETHLRKLSYIKKTKAQGYPLIAIRQKIEEIEQNQAGAFGTGISKSFKFEIEKNEELKKCPALPIKRSEKSNRTRQRILEAGCYLFQEKGYKTTKISEITKKLNIGKGTFYFYFSNKQELLLECVPIIFQTLFEKSWSPIREAKDPQKRLEQRAFAVLPVLQEFCAIIQLSKEALEDPDPKIRQLGEETFLSIRTPLELDIKRCIQQGIFQPIDPKIASTLMIGLIENLYYMRTIYTDLETEELWTNIFKLMLDGMRQKNGSHRHTPS
jgi:AcrR family transcriptional regulator/predicted DNA-binding transcriptional regulator AlpA